MLVPAAAAARSRNFSASASASSPTLRLSSTAKTTNCSFVGLSSVSPHSAATSSTTTSVRAASEATRCQRGEVDQAAVEVPAQHRQDQQAEQPASGCVSSKRHNRRIRSACHASTDPPPLIQVPLDGQPARQRQRRSGTTRPAGPGTRRRGRRPRRSPTLVSPSGGRRSLSALFTRLPANSSTGARLRRRRHDRPDAALVERADRHLAAARGQLAASAVGRLAAGTRPVAARQRRPRPSPRSAATRAARPGCPRTTPSVFIARIGNAVRNGRSPWSRFTVRTTTLPSGRSIRREQRVAGHRPGQHLRLAGGRGERQLAGLGHQDVVEPDVGHQRRVLVLLRHDRVLQLLADLPQVAVVRRVDDQDRARRQLGRHLAVEDRDRPGGELLRHLLGRRQPTSGLASRTFSRNRLPAGTVHVHRHRLALRQDGHGLVVRGQGVRVRLVVLVALHDEFGRQQPAVGRGLLDDLAPLLARRRA